MRASAIKWVSVINLLAVFAAESELNVLRNADLNCGLGYELLMTAIDRMQQDIKDLQDKVSNLQENPSNSNRMSLGNYPRRPDHSEMSNSTMYQPPIYHQPPIFPLRDDPRFNRTPFPNQTYQPPTRTRRPFRLIRPSTTRTTTVEPPAEMYPSCDASPNQGKVLIQIPRGSLGPFEVFCTQAEVLGSGNWMVIFRRNATGLENFNRGWDDYVNGFGDVEDEHWLGLEKMHQLTSSYFRYKLAIRVELHDGREQFAIHDGVSIGSERNNYDLRLLGNDTGSLIGGLRYYNGQHFSTYDVNNIRNPTENCPQIYGSGWWFRNCEKINDEKDDCDFKVPTYGCHLCLKSAEMMIRWR